MGEEDRKRQQAEHPTAGYKVLGQGAHVLYKPMYPEDGRVV